MLQRIQGLFLFWSNMDFRDELYFLALTVAQEAGWEPFMGQLAVAHVIVNRTKCSKASVIDTVFRNMQFSCWNTNSPTRMNLDTIPDGILKISYMAAAAAYFNLKEDPSNGATHYLNEEVTRKLRGGSLPGWFDEGKVTVRIGQHTFLKL
jgi:spore germination cell wall hydrolase CwlJ-like protein